ncbi:MAG: GldG family protein [Patescibacteria group bacterium]|nr:GldG family protein [Patescibacteria group bacterium]
MSDSPGKQELNNRATAASSAPRKKRRFKLPPLPKLSLTKLFGLARYNKPYIFAIAAVAVLALNILITPFAIRIDLSRNRANTLSEGSQKLVRALKKPVTITFFVSDDIPTQLLPLRQEVSDLLAEYRRVSWGKVDIRVLNPKTDDDAREEAAQQGIQEFRFSQIQQDKFNVSTGYFALLVSYDQQKRPILNLNDTANLEYNITSAIYSVTRDQTPKIAILGGEPRFGGFGQQSDPLTQIRQILQQEYTLEPLSLTEPQTEPPVEGVPTPTPVAKSIDSGIKTIVLLPSRNPAGYSDVEIEQLSDYLNRKGKIIALFDGMGVNQQILATESGSLDLANFAKNYGIQVRPDLVLSESAEVVNFGGDVQQFFVPYPFWIRTAAFTGDSGLFSNVGYLNFPWTSSLKVTETPGINTRVLVRTETGSWVQEGTFTLDPQAVLQQRPQNTGQYDLIAEAVIKDKGTLMVIPSSRFINPQFLSRESGNLNFFLNVLSNYASDGVLSGIRSRAIQSYPLPNLPDAQKDLVKYLAMLALPVLVGAGGAFYLIRRK